MDWIAKSFYGIGGQKIMDAVCKDQDEESSKAKSVRSKRCNFSAAVKRNLNIAQRDKLEKLRLFCLFLPIVHTEGWNSKWLHTEGL